MDQLSISQLAQFSGVKAHTIRMWEQRYQALQPDRSEGNTRYYDNSQLRRLLNIVSLAQGGSKISELCVMPDKRLFSMLEEHHKTATSGAEEYFISQLIMAGLNYDEAHFDKIFSHVLLRYGMKNSYRKIIYPVLVRMGFMWRTDTLLPANEHFISNLFRQKLCTAIDVLPPPKVNSDCWILFLPENEFHDIGLLFAQYLVRLYGKKVIYLGSNVPLPSLAKAVSATGANRLLLFLVHRNSEENHLSYLLELSTILKNKKIFVAGKHALSTQLKIKDVFYPVLSIEDLEEELNN